MDVITEHLEKDGYYEFQVRGHYTGKPDEFMYRRLQYYYLDDTHDTILVVQSDVTNAVLQQKKENAYVEDILDSVSTGIVSFRMPDSDHLEGSVRQSCRCSASLAWRSRKAPMPGRP
jgi:hypothetical protein